MFDSLAIRMEMKRPPPRPLGDAAAALFEHLLLLFAPRRFVYARGLGEIHYLTRGDRGHWDGEELTSDALTSCPPGEASELVAELSAALATSALEELWVGAKGALLHRAPHAAEPAWFGRWRMGRSLHELVNVSFGWSDELRGFEIDFPNDGYPLTSAELRAAAVGERWIDRTDATASSANRTHLFALLATLPDVLGLARVDVRWGLAGDVAAIEARYPDDAAAIDVLLARLRA